MWRHSVKHYDTHLLHLRDIRSLLIVNVSYDHQRFKKIMRATQGALIVASTLQIVLGFTGLWRNVVRFVNVTMLMLAVNCSLPIA